MAMGGHHQRPRTLVYQLSLFTRTRRDTNSLAVFRGEDVEGWLRIMEAISTGQCGGNPQDGMVNLPGLDAHSPEVIDI